MKQQRFSRLWSLVRGVLSNQRGEVNLEGFWPGQEQPEPEAPQVSPEHPTGLSSPPAAAPTPPAPSELDALRSQVQFLSGLVMRQQQAPAPQQQAPSTPAADVGLPEWKDGEFLTDAETMALLNADPKNMREMFNRMLNNVGRTVDGKYREVVGKLEGKLTATERAQNERLQEQERQRTQSEFRSQFFGANPDLSGSHNEFVVGRAAVEVQQQQAAQPWMFQGGPQQVMHAIAERARQLRTEIQQQWGSGNAQQQGAVPPATPTPKGQRRFFTESNNSSRAGATQEKDPIKRGVGELIDFSSRRR